MQNSSLFALLANIYIYSILNFGKNLENEAYQTKMSQIYPWATILQT